MSKKATKEAKVEQEATKDEALEKALAALPTKSARIRFLAAKNFSTGVISKMLNLRYQHVRNVLKTELKRPVKA